MNPKCTLYRLGRVEYPDGLELQQQFQEAHRAGLVGDTLLLLEHPPVLTMGRAAKAMNIVAPAPELERLGVGVFETDRGGDVTYHGPGQIVGYPLLFLPPGRQDVRRYVRSLEEVIIRALADFGLAAARIEKWPGVWIERSRAGGPRKICALGVHLSRWYTRHGFALNVSTQLASFDLIVPCGIKEAGVTSMVTELDGPVSQEEVEARLVHHFEAVFETALEPGPEPASTVSVVVLSAGPAPRVLALRRTEARGGFWQPVTGTAEAGEAPAAAARRELHEETGLEASVTPLGYVHAFAWGAPRRAPAEGGEVGPPLEPPRLARETAFVAHADESALVRLDPSEHVEAEWVLPEEALRRFPFAGLRAAVRLALRA